MKKILLTVTVILMLCCTFCACSKSAKSNTTTTADTTAATTTQGVTDSINYDSDLIYYDRNGKAHDSLADLAFYDKDGNEYHYTEDLKNPYFTDDDGKQYAGKNSYVDTDGYFVYDDNGSITISSDGFSAEGKDGTTYYPAATVRWDVDGNLVTVFGYGDTVKKAE